MRKTDIIVAMVKKRWIAVLCLMLAGCAGTAPSGSVSAASASASETAAEDTYDAYLKANQNRVSADSYTASVRSSYRMKFSDETYDVYGMDGVLEIMNLSADPTAHIEQHFDSNGMASSIDGYYYGGRLYNTYNGVKYYEDLSLQDLKGLMLVPMDPAVMMQDELNSVTVNTDEQGNTSYVLVPKDPASLFSGRYDFHDLGGYDDFEVKSAAVTDTFDQAGHFISEKAEFLVSFSYQGEVIETEYTGIIEYILPDETVVEISDEQKAEHAEYVSVPEIDTEAIETMTVDDDSPEATVADTFRKRLVSRLNYTETSDGIYRVEFNGTEAYVINFNNSTFEYSNYSIVYSYSWKGDVGSMGGCTYQFAADTSSSGCEDTTVETIRNVKKFLQMELYYCGLSLNDLQNETNQEG